MVATGFHVAHLRHDFEAKASCVEFSRWSHCDNSHHLVSRVRCHHWHVVTVNRFHVDALIIDGIGEHHIRIQHGIFITGFNRNRCDDLAHFLCCEVCAELFDHAPFDIPSTERTHAREFVPNECFTVFLGGVVVQFSPIRNVAVVGDVHFESNDSSWS